MDRPILKPYFLIALALYITVHLGRFGWYEPIPLINSYLTDFLCMPIILTLCLAGVRIIKRMPLFTLTPFMIFGMTFFYAILFEYILPSKNPMYTSDLIDVLMYFAGAIVYWMIWNSKRQHSEVEVSS